MEQRKQRQESEELVDLTPRISIATGRLSKSNGEQEFVFLPDLAQKCKG